MSWAARAFAISGIVSLIVATVLHEVVLLGDTSAWGALIHLLIFGWISALIIAVNYHTVPVFSRRDFAYPWLLIVHWAFFAPGIVLTVIALLLAWDVGTIIGLLLEIIASFLFSANIILLFVRGSRQAGHPMPPPFPNQAPIDKVGTQATRLAGICLPLALLLLVGARLRWFDPAWVLAAEHTALLGWVMLMIVGVAYHVLPRFSGHELRGLVWVRAQLTCHLIGLILIASGLGWGWPAVFAAGGLTMALALALFAWTIWPTLQPITVRPIMLQPTVKKRSS